MIKENIIRLITLCIIVGFSCYILEGCYTRIDTFRNKSKISRQLKNKSEKTHSDSTINTHLGLWTKYIPIRIGDDKEGITDYSHFFLLFKSDSTFCFIRYHLYRDTICGNYLLKNDTLLTYEKNGTAYKYLYDIKYDNLQGELMRIKILFSSNTDINKLDYFNSMVGIWSRK